MIQKTITVTKAQGLHMRPAGLLAAAMGKKQCNVTVMYNGRSINAKSVMNLMAAGIKCGSQLQLVCDGADEEQAMQEAVALLQEESIQETDL